MQPRMRTSPWKHDPRSKNFSHQRFFGSTSSFPVTLGRPRMPILDQKNTLRCTGYSGAADGSYIHGIKMSGDWQAAKVGQIQGYSVDQNGGDPNAAMKSERDYGFLPAELAPKSLENDGIGPTGWDKWPSSLDALAARFDNIPGFVRVDGPRGRDTFDNIKNALLLAYDHTTQRGPVVRAFGRWLSNWSNTPGGIIPIEEGSINGYHAYLFIDWITHNGVEYLVAHNSYGTAFGSGGFHYFPREVVNREFALFGTSLKICKTLTKEQLELAKQETILGRIQRAIIDIWYAISERFGVFGGDTAVSLMQRLIALLEQLRSALETRKNDPQPTPTPNPTPVPPKPTYDWSTPQNARHSVRLICDDEGLTLEQKNTLCATVGAESGWKPRAIGKPNNNGSRDYGICQINDALWIGKGKDFPSIDFVLDNPERCIRWMCYWWKKGKRTWWIAYKNNLYKQYL